MVAVVTAGSRALRRAALVGPVVVGLFAVCPIARQGGDAAFSATATATPEGGATGSLG